MAFTETSPENKAAVYLVDSEVCSPKKVLAADNDKCIANYILHTLEQQFGCSVDIAENGYDAMTMLDRVSYDALICDRALPGMTGLELAHEARNAFPVMGILIMSDKPDDSSFLEAIKAGATDFIAKPFQPDELTARLIRIFNEADLHNERRLETLKYRSLFDLNIDGMALLDGDAAVIRDVNKSLLELMGEKKGHLVGKPVSALLDVGDRHRFEQWLSLCALIGHGTIAGLKLAHIANSNIYVDISMSVVKNEAQFDIFLALKNITERREMQLRLDEITQRDMLTGLFNRRSFLNRTHGAVRSAQEYNIPTTLMLIDMDGLNTFNDKYGHAVGDQMLVEAAAAISIHIHPSTGNACFRYDGDEFAILLGGVDADEGRQIAKRIQDEFYSRDTKGMTISIGLAEYQNNQSVEDFVRAAEKAVREAQEAGNNVISEARD